MVPKFANSKLTACVLAKTSAVTSRAICSLVFPKGGSKTPILVGIALNFCCNKVNKTIVKTTFLI